MSRARRHNSFLTASAAVAVLALLTASAALAAPATEDEAHVQTIETTDSHGKENKTICEMVWDGVQGHGHRQMCGRRLDDVISRYNLLREFLNQTEHLADLPPLLQQRRQFVETLEAACHDSVALNGSYLRYAHRLYKQGVALEKAMLRHGAAAPLTPAPAPAPAPTPPLTPEALAYKKYKESLKDACRDVEHVKKVGDAGLLRQAQQLSKHAVALLQFVPQYRGSVPPAPTPRPKSDAELAMEELIQAILDVRPFPAAATTPTPAPTAEGAQAAELATLRQELAALRRREGSLNETTQAIKAVSEQDLGAAIVALKAAAEKIGKALAAIGQHDGAAAAPSPTTTAAPPTTLKTAAEKAAELQKLQEQLEVARSREEVLEEVIERFTEGGRDIETVQMYVDDLKETAKVRAGLEQAIAVLQHAPTTTPRPTPAPRRKTGAEKAAEMVKLQRRLAEVGRDEKRVRDSMKYWEDRGSFDTLGSYVRAGLRLAEERAGLEQAIATLQFSAADEQPQPAALREAVQSVKALAEQDLGGAILGLQAAAEKIAKALAAVGLPQPAPSR